MGAVLQKESRLLCPVGHEWAAGIWYTLRVYQISSGRGYQITLV